MFYLKKTVTAFTKLTCAGMMIMSAHAGPIEDMMANNPDQARQIIESGSYADLLQFVQSAYAESTQANGELAQYAYILALDQAPLDKKVPLAIDFSLVNPELLIKQFGARSIIIAVTQGATIPTAQRDQVIAKLKTELSALGTPSREAYDFARSAADALMAFGDDAGLDVFLTDTQTAGNYRSKDAWEPTSAASVFAQLKTHYEQRASDAANQNPAPDRVMAAAYELARVRRTQNKEIKPLQPLANLDQLLPK